MEITKAEAIKLYDSSNADGQKLLSDKFGVDMFCGDIIDRVNDLQDACSISGDNIDDVLPFKEPKNAFQEALNAVATMWKIIEVINEGWIADYDDPNQKKYTPWWLKQAGLGLSFFDYAYSRTVTCVGARLSFGDLEKMKKATNKYAHIYNKFLTINKTK